MSLGKIFLVIRLRTYEFYLWYDAIFLLVGDVRKCMILENEV